MFNPNNYIKTLKPHIQNPILYIPISLYRHVSFRKPSLSNPAIRFVLDESKEFQPPKERNTHAHSAEKVEEVSLVDRSRNASSKFQVFHPWPEWVNLMETLLKNEYFDAIGSPFGNNKGEMGVKEANLIRTACLNFARDRSDLIRYLSRKDVLVIAGSGCPSTDRKVVNSGKRLRAHMGLDEGNVCSSCTLRGDCERAYVKARPDEGGRTVDVMRFVVTYGLDPTVSSVENKPCLNKRVTESLRTLLKELVDYSTREHDPDPPKVTTSQWSSSMRQNYSNRGSNQSNVQMKPGDWSCPKCNFLNFARNVKCLCCNGFFHERLRKLSEEDYLPLKKGDWICIKCNFLNFAKNTRCLQCKERPPERKLNPGEWECESCNYINFRRNMVCLKCDHKRPIASNTTGYSSGPGSSNVHYHQAQPRFGNEQRNRNQGSGSRNFIDCEYQDGYGSTSDNHDAGFMDFPVVGGKSDLSRNVQMQEIWKMEMVDNRRTVVQSRKNDGDFKSSMALGNHGFLESDDDDEMAEWFGHRKYQADDSEPD